MEETKQALVFVDVRNPRLIGTWDDLGEGVHIPGPLNPGWGYSKRWRDSRDWDDGDAAWEGNMSEGKAEYYAKHLETLASPEVQPTGLPTLLAQMVNEYHGALKLNGYSGFPDRLVEGFSQMLLACAQPAITAYLEQLTNPPKFVVREQ